MAIAAVMALNFMAASFPHNAGPYADPLGKECSYDDIKINI